MAKITFAFLERLARDNGYILDRTSRRRIFFWKQDNSSVVTECSSLTEAYKELSSEIKHTNKIAK